MERRELVVGRYRIPVAIFGGGDRCLVCVNAAQQTMGAWGTLAKRFANRGGYRVVLFDFPNQGRASNVGRALTLSEQADVLHFVIREVSPGDAVDVCGASWGALVAAACAARFPTAFRKLMLGSFQVRSNARLRTVAAESVGLIERGARRELADQFIREFGAGLPESFRALVRSQFGALSDAQLVQVREQCATLAAGAELRQVVDLDRVTAETLIVNGSRDPIVDAADYPANAGCFRRAELRVLAGVGHFLHLEDEKVMDIYLEFALRGERPAGRIDYLAAGQGPYSVRPKVADRNTDICSRVTAAAGQ